MPLAWAFQAPVTAAPPGSVMVTVQPLMSAEPAVTVTLAVKPPDHWLTATDAENDSLTYSMTGAPSGASLSGTVFSYTPSYDVAPSGGSTGFNVTFKVTDSKGASDSQVVTITVNNKNRAPVLSAIGSKSVTEGDTLVITLAASDADGDSVTFSVSGAPAGASLSGNRFTYTPAVGTVTSGTSLNIGATFSVTDGKGGSDSEAVTVRVDKKAVTEPPPSGVVFTSKVETAEFTIETANDNNRTNGRLEGLAQGTDGSVYTKCLHW